ncbi:MAG: pyruvate dehydrogenase complex dihydrolipoamide acetyltransferase [Bdellovibrionales bacterium]
MPISILMPALSPTMTEGNLAKWHKKVGDTVKAGEVIAEIETDKATMEVEAVDEGRIGKILIEQGAQAVKVNTPIAILLEEGEDEKVLSNHDSAQTAGSKTAAPGAGAAADAQRGAGQHQQPKTGAQAPGPAVSQTGRNDRGPAAGRFNQFSGTGADSRERADLRIKASPLARRIAEQKGVDLRQVQGSGPGGRVVRDDVESFTPSAGSVSRAAASMPQGIDAMAQANALGQKYIAVPNNQIRKIVAKRLLEAKQTIPHFYLTVDCKIDKLLDARAQLNSAGGEKISVNDMVIKAVAKSLVKVPAANASWSDDAILQYENVDISVAVATPNGLVTPIITDADQRSIADISATMKDLAARAKDNKLKPTEFQGGGFTISNLGMYGISHFSAIINPPQSCILAVGAGEQKAVVVDGQIGIATVMSVTLSVDHRSVDGAVGAEFLQAFKQFIENPVLLLV